jgi:hypothetical protein
LNALRNLFFFVFVLVAPYFNAATLPLATTIDPFGKPIVCPSFHSNFETFAGPSGSA